MKIRLLLLHNILWSHYKATVFSELNALIKSKYDLQVIQFAVTEKQRKNLGELDLSLHKYPYKLLFNCSLDEMSQYKKIMAIFGALKTNPYDIIIIPGYAYLMCWVALLYSKLKRKVIIVSFDSTDMDNPHPWYKEAIKKWFIAQCNAGYTYGTKSKEYLMKLGMKSEVIFTRCQATNNEKIYELCSEARSKRDHLVRDLGVSPFNFIYVGRLSNEKNIERMLLAFDKLKKNHALADSWGLIIVGAGPEKDHLQRIIAVHGIPNVYFVGGHSWTNVVKYYAISNVFVLPSLSEPWGLVVNEAMICGLPVIVSNRCGAAYDLVIQGENGFTFDPQDTEALTRHLVYFLDNPEALARMGDRSKHIITDYTPERAAKQMYEGLKSVRISIHEAQA